MKTLIAFVFVSPLTELSTGLLTFAQFGHKDITDAKVLFDGSFLQVDKLLYFFINFAVKTQNGQAPLGLYITDWHVCLVYFTCEEKQGKSFQTTVPVQRCLHQNCDELPYIMFRFPGQSTQVQSLPATAEEDNVQSEGVDSDHFSGSNSSFLANEKLMSVDSMNSDITGMTKFHVPVFYSFIVLNAY